MIEPKKYIDRIDASVKMSELFEWEKWNKEIPFIKFKSNWFVKIIPPDTGAVIRFRVSLNPDFEKSVSIYLDCYDALGSYGEPYWELYPYNDDTYRCEMNETKKLIDAIEVALKEMFPRNEILKIKLDSLEIDNG